MNSATTPTTQDSSTLWLQLAEEAIAAREKGVARRLYAAVLAAGHDREEACIGLQQLRERASSPSLAQRTVAHLRWGGALVLCRGPRRLIALERALQAAELGGIHRSAFRLAQALRLPACAGFHGRQWCALRPGDAGCRREVLRWMIAEGRHHEAQAVLAAAPDLAADEPALAELRQILEVEILAASGMAGVGLGRRS